MAPVTFTISGTTTTAAGTWGIASSNSGTAIYINSTAASTTTIPSDQWVIVSPAAANYYPWTPPPARSVPQVDLDRANRERELSEAKARRLLKSMLTGPEWREYKVRREVLVDSRHIPGAKYKMSAGDIRVVGGEYDGARLCFHTVDQDLPEADRVAAKVAYARYDEATLIRTANWSQRNGSISRPRVGVRA